MQTRLRLAGMVALLALFLTAAVQAGGIAVPAGAGFQVNGGRIELAGGDVRIDGLFGIGAGELRGSVPCASALAARRISAAARLR